MASQDSGKRFRSPFFWGVIAAGAVFLCFYALALVLIARHGGSVKDFGWNLQSNEDGVFVAAVDPAGPASGKLQSGDRIVALNGDNRVGKAKAVQTSSSTSSEWSALGLRLQRVPPGALYSIRIQRGAAVLDFRLSAPLKRDTNSLVSLLFLFAVSLIWYAVGMLIGVMKPWERLCQLASAACLAAALSLLQTNIGLVVDVYPLFEHWEAPLFYAVSFIHPLHLAIAFHFWCYFLFGSSRPRLWTFVQYLMYALATFLAIAFRWKDAMATGPIDPAIEAFLVHGQFLKFLATFHDLFFFSSLLLMIGMAARNYRLFQDPDQRRRFKLFTFGSVLGISPMMLTQLAQLLVNAFGAGNRIEAVTWTGVYNVAKVCTILVPLSLAYAMLKHRVLDVGLVIRLGVQHLLAKNFLRILLWVPVAVLVSRLISNPDQTVAQALFHNTFYLILFAATLLGLRFRRQVMEAIDRRFFREAYDREKILMDLIAHIRKSGSMLEISRKLGKELDSALHPKSIYIFYRQTDQRELTLNYSSGIGMRNLRVAEDSRLVALMEEKEGSAEYPFANQRLPPEEERLLEGLQIALIVPMIGTDRRLVGMLLLGERKAEEPYAAGDRRLLEVVMDEIAMVYENVTLKQRIEREHKVQRQVLAQLGEQKINLLRECPACGACFDSSIDICDVDSEKLTLSLPVDRVIDQKYRLEKLIGKGGMGAVYEATDLRLGRRVAVKILIGSMFGDQMALQRFQREARACAKLSHPNIVTVYDFGTVRGEGAYLVMELVSGRTLRKDLQRSGSLPPAQVADLFQQILEGMKHAHKQGIVHRDLKPDNILISTMESGEPVAKVLDFGLAKMRLLEAEDSHTLTVPGTMLGTLDYMPPEQLAGDQEVTERSDIFSLGVIAVECLTGSRPFSGDSSAAVVTAILRSSFQLEAKIGDAGKLDGVLQKCLAKDPTERYASIDEMQKELIHALRICTPGPFVVHRDPDRV